MMHQTSTFSRERRPALALCLISAFMSLAVSGCYYSTRLTQTPPAMVLSPRAAPDPIPLAIESVTASLNGTPTSAGPSFEKDYVNGLRTLGFFSPVLNSDRADEAPAGAARMTLAAVVTIDPHQGSAIVKGFFIGLSLYLLTPVLPLTHDVAQTVNATLTLPNGKVRQYQVTSSGRGTYALGSNSALMEAELNSKVGTATLQGLLNRIREDDALRPVQ